MLGGPISSLHPIRSRTKVDAAHAALRELARKLGAGSKLPTVKEICARLNISSATLEDVLFGLERQRVIVRRKGSGIYVSPRFFQRNVGLVFGRRAFQPGSSLFCGMLVERCQRRAQSHAESFSFYLDVPRAESGTDDKSPVHGDLAEALSNGHLNGLLLVARHSVEQEQWLRSQGIPVVTFTAGATGEATVSFDRQDMARRGALALAERGCRRVAMINAYNDERPLFDDALTNSSLPISGERYLNALDGPAGMTRLEAGARALRALVAPAGTLLSAGDRPDGLIVMDDMLMLGAATAAQQLGLTIGRDLLVASHANVGSITLQAFDPAIIHLEIDPDVIVEQMFRMLEEMMTSGDSRHEPVFVPVNVRHGGGVGRFA